MAFFYDLSELFHISGAGFKYYGIARTVMEVGLELARSYPDVRFVVYSSADGRFYEVTPRVGEDSPTNLIDPSLPVSARPIKLRTYLAEPSYPRDLVYPLLRRAVEALNRRRWKTVEPGSVKPVDLDGEVLVTLTRPKLIANFVHALRERGEAVRLYPVLYDLIPLHEMDERGGTEAALPSFAVKFLNDNRYVISQAEHALTISNATRDDVMYFHDKGWLPLPRRLDTVQLCHELREAPPVDLPDHIPERFLLAVGIMQGRKNLECVLRAMAVLAASGRPVPHLVLAGAKRKRTVTLLEGDEFEAIRDKVVFCENPDQATLCALYERATALVIASFIEGWGLPLGEALWAGTPAIAARVPALLEVGGDLPLYFDPESPDELAACIDALANDGGTEREHRRRIREAKPDMRRWADVADEIAAFARGGALPPSAEA